MASYKLVAVRHNQFLGDDSLICKIARTICLIICLSCMHIVLLASDGTDSCWMPAIKQSALSVEKTPTSKMDQIVSSLKSFCKNDKERAYALYIWISNNVRYDVASLADGTYAKKYQNMSKSRVAEIVFRDGMAVCGGYACLYEAMGSLMGLDIQYIRGFSKGINYAIGKPPTDPDHAWNAVRINRDIILLDCSWGAGYIRNGKFVKSINDFYFETPPEVFIYDHFPEDCSKQFLTPDKIYSRAKYNELVELRPEFFQNKLKIIDRQASKIVANSRAEITVGAPSDVVIKPEVYDKAGEKTKNASSTISRIGDRIKVIATFPEKGEYIVRLHAKHKSDKGDYVEVVNYNVTAQSGTSNAPVYPQLFDPYLVSNAELISPVQALLPVGSPQFFKLTVPGARKVVVDINGSMSFLTNNGDTFEDTVTINGKDGDSVDVYAQFEGDKNLTELVSYKIVKQASASVNP